MCNCHQCCMIIEKKYCKKQYLFFVVLLRKNYYLVVNVLLPTSCLLMCFMGSNILFYACGIGLFVFFNHEAQSERCYFSENALLPGLVQLQHSPNEMDMQSFSSKCKLYSNKSIEDLKNVLQQLGFEAYEQKYQFQNDFIKYKDVKNGTNVYGIIRGSRAASTECIIINIPIIDKNLNFAGGVALAFGQLARNEMFWAKDIIILFSQHGTHGVRAWLDVYHGMSSPHIKADDLPARAGSIQAAVVLELPEPDVSYINLKLEGRNGQLPNLDLVNLVVRLSRTERIPLSINHQFEPRSSTEFENLEQYLTSSLSMMKKLASGKSSGNHGEFLIYNAPALTIQGVNNLRWVSSRLVGIERLLNGICRSLNNLLERFHQSFFFYFLPSIDRYISISMFMPCFGLVLIPAIVKALSILVAMSMELSKASNKSEMNDSEVLDKLLKDSGSKLVSFAENNEDYSPPVWYEVLSMLVLSYLCGILLFYSPNFTSVWSEMYELPPETCFVLLQLFVFVLGLGLIYSFKISLHAAAALRVVSLLLVSIVLGTLAITNFSFGYIAAILIVPPSLLITHHPGRLFYLNKILALLVSPVSVCLVLFKTADDYVEIYNWHATSQSVFYSVYSLLFFPHWLQLWAVTNGRVKNNNETDLKQKKE